jgi:RNA polymerase sigma factor (TIGR02999 family)
MFGNQYSLKIAAITLELLDRENGIDANAFFLHFGRGEAQASFPKSVNARVVMSEVTRILSAMEHGEAQAAERLLPLVYDELRKLAAQRLAQEKPGQTLQATALVHEAYLRLVDVDRAQQWNSRGHFFSAAAEAMRRILVEQARQKKSAKGGGGRERVPLDGEQLAAPSPNIDLVALDEALAQLASHDSRKAELVKLRFFAGMTISEAAGVLGIADSTADADWAYAKSWLRVEMRES